MTFHFKLFPRKRKQTKAPVIWDKVNVSEATVKTYFEKYSDGQLDVPLAIARQVREEVVQRIINAQKFDLEKLQGELIAIDRLVKVYVAGVEQQNRKIMSGGRTLK